jgi:septal ring factor EnvC (AmiA/AmiB activator)
LRRPKRRCASRQALAQAEQRRSSLQTNLAQQHRELAGLLRAAYQLGNHAPLKLLLSQDTVADANRALAYHRYLQRERAQRITTLTADLKELEALQAQIAERKQKLQGAQQDQKQQAAALAADRRDRAQTVASLDERFKDRREKEQALGQDAKALETLLANLRAAAARAEAERRAAARRAAAEKAAAERAARQAAAQGRPPPPTRFRLRWRRHRHRRSAAWAGRCPATCWPATAASCPMAAPAAAC